MKLGESFFQRDVLEVAPDLIGKSLVRRTGQTLSYYVISEVEAYRGSEDQACHARFGKTSRNAVMFEKGGLLYVYFIYGMYWMLNVVTASENKPQAVLIRGFHGISGPGRLTRELRIDKSFYGESLVHSDRIWMEDTGLKPACKQTPRIGINYAQEPWKSIPWRYIMVPQLQNS